MSRAAVEIVFDSLTQSKSSLVPETVMDLWQSRPLSAALGRSRPLSAALGRSRPPSAALGPISADLADSDKVMDERRARLIGAEIAESPARARVHLGPHLGGVLK